MIENLLDMAEKVKDTVVEKYALKRRFGKTGNCIFICCSGDMRWQNMVTPFMQDTFGKNTNNIFDYVSLQVGLYPVNFFDPESKIIDLVTEKVRIQWLDDLISIAKINGDDAELPPLMSKENIINLYRTLNETERNSNL